MPVLCLLLVALAAAVPVAHAAEGASQGSPGATPVYPVEVLRLSAQHLQQVGNYLGTVLPRRRVTLRAEREGLVEQVTFDEGVALRAGQVLVHIATEQTTAERNLARSNLELARFELERAESLFAKALLPQAQLELAQAREREAFYAFRLQQLLLRQSRVQAPLDAMAAQRLVNPGEFVHKAQELAVLVDIDTVRVEVFIPEREIRFVRQGRAARVTVEALAGSGFDGRVAVVGPEADPRNRSFPVLIDVANPKRRLRPGMLAQVALPLHSQPAQVLVPAHAVVEGEHGPLVYLLREGRAQLQQVRRGLEQDNMVQLIGPVSPGDDLIVTGVGSLADGAPVDVTARSVQPPHAMGQPGAASQPDGTEGR